LGRDKFLPLPGIKLLFSGQQPIILLTGTLPAPFVKNKACCTYDFVGKFTEKFMSIMSIKVDLERGLFIRLFHDAVLTTEIAH
jgi:hypothetical protein